TRGSPRSRRSTSMPRPDLPRVFLLEFLRQPASAEASAEFRDRTSGLDADATFLRNEDDAITGVQPELVSDGLWDHDLALRANLRSHTVQYNRGWSGEGWLARARVGAPARAAPLGEGDWNCESA